MGDQGTDSASMYFGIEKKPYYFNHELFGYFTRKNLLNYQVKIDQYNQILPTRAPETFKDFMNKIHDSNYYKATMLGFCFKYDKWAQQRYFIQEFQPFKNKVYGRQITSFIKMSTQKMPIEGIRDSIVESSKKISYVVKMD